MEKTVLVKEEIKHYTVVEGLLREHFNDKPISMLEIGVDGAAMEKHLLSKLDNITIIGVDKNLVADTLIFSIASKGRFTYLNTTSDFALKTLLLAGKKFDFIYIDGGHYEIDVKKDIVNSMLLTEKGSIIAGHDYCDNVWDVKKVVDNMFGDMVNTGPNLTWWVYV